VSLLVFLIYIPRTYSMRSPYCTSGSDTRRRTV